MMIGRIIKLFLVCVAFLASARCEEQDCMLPLPRFAFFAPLIFSPNGTLLKTESENEHCHNITVLAGDHVILSCAPNYFKNNPLRDTKLVRASCKSGQTFVVNGVEKHWLKDLGCEMRSVEEILKPISGCPNEFESVEFGYTNPIKEKSLVLGEACYSKKEGRTRFLHTKIAGANNPISVSLKYEAVNYFGQKHPDSTYKIDFLMAARLDELNERLTQTLSTRIPFLEPRHFIEFPILPNGQLYSILKLGWNFVIANGYDSLSNWDLLQMDIMNLNSRNFDLYMGTHDVLSLKNSLGRPIDIYLRDEEKKFPVPKFLWIVVTTDDKKAVAFVISNDIDANEEELMKDNVCESKCTQISWLKNLLQGNSQRKTKHGYVWCCDIQSFAEKIDEMPTLIGKFDLLA